MEKDSIFKFKRATKSIGDFNADDSKEWCLLTKPQIGDVTLFVHFHKLWLVTEVPEVQEDEENGIEYQPGIQRVPVCEVFFGFVKDDKFVVERQQKFQERIDDLANKTFVKNLQRFIDEGYKKDWNNYKGDDPIVPNYYSHQQHQGSPIRGNGAISSPGTPGVIKSTKGLFKHLMLKGGNVIQSVQSSGPKASPAVEPDQNP